MAERTVLLDATAEVRGAHLTLIANGTVAVVSAADFPPGKYPTDIVGRLIGSSHKCMHDSAPAGRPRLLAVMVYSFARVSAVVGMRVEDYYQQGKRWLRRPRREAPDVSDSREPARPATRPIRIAHVHAFTDGLAACASRNVATPGPDNATRAIASRHVGSSSCVSAAALSVGALDGGIAVSETLRRMRLTFQCDSGRVRARHAEPPDLAVRRFEE